MVRRNLAIANWGNTSKWIEMEVTITPISMETNPVNRVPILLRTQLWYIRPLQPSFPPRYRCKESPVVIPPLTLVILLLACSMRFFLMDIMGGYPPLLNPFSSLLHLVIVLLHSLLPISRTREMFNTRISSTNGVMTPTDEMLEVLLSLRLTIW